jgi:hypothetical protein
MDRGGHAGDDVMVQVRRSGISDPKRAFEELRPYRLRLIAMMDRCRPFHADFLILHAAQRALDAAAHYFTGEPDFFALKPDQSKWGGSA